MPNGDNCKECGKPLGSTVERCFECGGTGRRGGQPIDPHAWQIMLGVKPQNLKEIDFLSRNYDLNSRGEVKNSAGS